jgi:amphi-Trp domain-containing protein
MDLIEIEQERKLIREDAAAWLHALADSLARHNEVSFKQAGKKVTVKVPREVTMEVELEVGVGDDGSSLEIEISW